MRKKCLGNDSDCNLLILIRNFFFEYLFWYLSDGMEEVDVVIYIVNIGFEFNLCYEIFSNCDNWVKICLNVYYL